MILVGLFIANYIVGQGGSPGLDLDLGIPFSSLLLGVAAIAVSVAAFARMPIKFAYALTYIGYALTAVAVTLTVAASGLTSSPFILLWMILAAMSGALNGIIPLALFLLSKAYLLYLYLIGGLDQINITTFELTTDMPLLVAAAIWYNKHHQENSKDQAFSALAKELSQVANKSEIVINAIADGVIAVDEKGLIQLINPAAQTIVGWGKQDALRLDYRSVLKLVDAQDKALVETTDPVQLCLRTNDSSVTDDLALLTTSGKRIMVSVLVSPVGKLGAGAIIVFRDITAQRAEERQQAEFISTASHEMRTPVAAIEGYLGLALNPQTATIDDKAKLYLEKAHEAAQHLGRLFQQLLDISKAEDGRLKNDPKLVDIVATMRDTSQSFLPAITAKGLSLVFKPDVVNTTQQRLSPVFYSLIDVDHLLEVTSNLIENAIKYTREGTITIDVTGDEKRVRIAVSDTGLGIPAEDIPHLFQKFYRIDSTDTREIGGTGLGLFLSRRLIESVGGRVDVQSEYGKGSTFIVEIDRMRQEDAMGYIEKHSTPNEVALAPIEPDKV